MVTKKLLKSALIDLGIEKGMMLEVHSSLSNFGELEGGAETIINGLAGTGNRCVHSLRLFLTKKTLLEGGFHVGLVTADIPGRDHGRSSASCRR